MSHEFSGLLERLLGGLLIQFWVKWFCLQLNTEYIISDFCNRLHDETNLFVVNLVIVLSQSRRIVFITTKFLHQSDVLTASAGVRNTNTALGAVGENAWGERVEKKARHHHHVGAPRWFQTGRTDCPRVWRVCNRVFSTMDRTAVGS